MLDDNRIYNELKCLNKKYHDLGISNARGEEKLSSINEQFKTLNGSVRKHEIKIGKIEKILYIALGIFGTLQFILSQVG